MKFYIPGAKARALVTRKSLEALHSNSRLGRKNARLETMSWKTPEATSEATSEAAICL